MNAQFELEQLIMDCWGVCDDLKLLVEGVLDRGLDEDEISNILLGMQGLYQLKFEKTFETFEKLLKEKHTEQTREMYGYTELDDEEN